MKIKKKMWKQILGVQNSMPCACPISISESIRCCKCNRYVSRQFQCQLCLLSGTRFFVSRLCCSETSGMCCVINDVQLLLCCSLILNLYDVSITPIFTAQKS